MNQLTFHRGRPVRSYGGLGQVGASMQPPQMSTQPPQIGMQPQLAPQQSLWNTPAGSTEVNPFLLRAPPSTSQFQQSISRGDAGDEYYTDTKAYRAAQAEYEAEKQAYLASVDPNTHAFGDASLLYRGKPGQGMGVRPMGFLNDSEVASGVDGKQEQSDWDARNHRFQIDQEVIKRNQANLQNTEGWQQLQGMGLDFSTGRPYQGDIREIYNKNPEVLSPLIGQLNEINRQAGGRYFGNPNDGGVDNTEKVALNLLKYGVTDLNDLRVQGDSVVSAKTGLPIPMKAFGGSSSGKGFTQFDLQIQDGRAIPTMRWEDSSDRGAIAGAAGILGMAFAPGISNMLNGALSGTSGVLGKVGTNMLTQGITGGISSAIAGGNPLTGALTGAVSAGISGAGAPWLKNLGLSPELTQGLVSGGIGGISSAIQGRNPWEGALLGGASGYTGSLLGQHGMANQWSPEAIRMSQGALSNFIRSKGDPMAAVQGGLRAAGRRRIPV